MGDSSFIRNFDQPSIDLNGKAILVTGGTGSFGQAFVKAVLERYEPSRLVIFSRDELKQTDMEFDLRTGPLKHRFNCLRFFIGDVRDRPRLTMAMRGIDYVIHAAALKHVPVAEYNPFECIHTNVVGAENVVIAAIDANVKKVLALSTDKAANPVNLYGASKLAADKIFVAANHLSGFGPTRFSVVRYGNVLGSRGSVVPLFKRLIAEKATELPITDPRMSRFWITIQQGVNFVLSSMAAMRGGEIFVPKIPSMGIMDLAESLAPHLPKTVIGIRPGEKLHEIMIPEDDARTTVELSDRYVIEPAFSWWATDEHRIEGAVPVPENFSYASNTNSEWLSTEELHRMLAED